MIGKQIKIRTMNTRFINIYFALDSFVANS